jgi:hypothetical protein
VGLVGVKRARVSGGLVPLAVSVLLLVAGLPAGSVAGAEPLGGTEEVLASPPPRSEEVALASGALREAVARLQAGQLADPRVEVLDDQVRVEVLHHLTTAAIERLIARLGGSVEGAVPGELVQARVPIDKLVDLEADPGVDFVRPPLVANEPAGEQSVAPAAAETRPAPASLIVGAEVTKTNAAAWHAAGYTGSGVKIGIVDYFGSSYWNAGVAAGELPAPAGTFCRVSGSVCDLWTAGQKHGEGVAEVIHEMAPGAQLYLATARTASDLQAAVDYFAAQGVKVISRSLTAEYDGPGNGTGPIATVIDNAVAAGMTWFNSAGNTAGGGSVYGQYWRGPWADANGNGWLDFAPGDEGLGMLCGFVNGLRWSDWGASRTDYDLWVYDDAALTVLKAKSEDNQATGALPLEHVALTCGVSDVDYVLVRLHAAGGGTGGDTLELMVNQAALEHWQNPYSASGPAADTASPGAATVGAIDPATGTTIAPYSSQGPTNDSRTKPDLSAAACVGTFTYGPDCFAGTSASTPVVAAAAALVLQAGLAGTPAQLKAYLLTQATVDRGAAGSDNVYGAGELVLPAPAPGPTPTTTVALTSNTTSAVSGETLVTFTATLSKADATGTVTFRDVTGAPTILGTGAVAASTATLQVRLAGAGTHLVDAVYGGDATYGPATSNAVAIVVSADTGVSATGVGVNYTTFYPYRDGYRDTVTIRGTLLEPASVAIQIRSSTGRLVRSLSVSTRSGAYGVAWNGRTGSGTRVAAGKYKVAQTISDAAGNSKVYTSYTTVSNKRLYWYSHTITKYGAQYSVYGDPGSGSVSTSKSSYSRGVRLSSGTAWVAVRYTFALRSATVYKPLTFKVLGRSPNGTKAYEGLWNRTLGSSLATGAYDKKVIGPKYAWYSMTGDSSTHRSGRSAYGLVYVEYSGGARQFDVAKVRLTYRYAILR